VVVATVLLIAGSWLRSASVNSATNPANPGESTVAQAEPNEPTDAETKRREPTHPKTEPGERTDAETEPGQSTVHETDPASTTDPETITVYITRTGTKYHRADCRYLRKSKIPISLKDAKKHYEPCSVCKPPR
jgi:cytoskeletal protein RodZ